jgi:hypothetical protein
MIKYIDKLVTKDVKKYTILKFDQNNLNNSKDHIIHPCMPQDHLTHIL